MATNTLSTQQLQQELQNELTASNQLLRLITIELQQIKQFTSPGGEFEANIKQVNPAVACANDERNFIWSCEKARISSTYNRLTSVSYKRHVYVRMLTYYPSNLYHCLKTAIIDSEQVFSRFKRLGLQNAELMAALTGIQQIDIENLPPVSHTQANLSNNGNKNLSYEQHETFRDSSNMEDSQ